MCCLLQNCEKQGRGCWDVYLKFDFISMLPCKQPKPLRKILFLKQPGHCGSSHPFSFCIVGTSLSVPSFPIIHWFQWGAACLTQGHRKGCCKSGSHRKQFLSVHNLSFTGPLGQSLSSNGAALAFLVSQRLMPSVLLHNAVTHSQLPLSLSEPLLIFLLFPQILLMCTSHSGKRVGRKKHSNES